MSVLNYRITITIVFVQFALRSHSWWSRRAHSSSSTHLLPSGGMANPVVHSHSYDPRVLMHRPSPQMSLSKHSFTSGQVEMRLCKQMKCAKEKKAVACLRISVHSRKECIHCCRCRCRIRPCSDILHRRKSSG